MTYQHFPHLLLCFFFALWISTAGAASETNTPPNVLLIMLDDLGYNDLGANGNPDAPTANLNALAAAGIRYTRHYADSVCSVARATMLTSRFPEAYGMRPDHLGLSKGTPTLASALQAAGYHTQHIGKWHLATATLEQSPSHYGFDDWFGFLHQMELQGESKDGIKFEKPTYLDPWLRENQSDATQFKGHLTEILTDRAIDYLQERQASSTPWFLNLWYYAPHTPLQPAPAFAKKHPDNDAGKYYALIEQLDFHIGRLLQALQEQGQHDNTLVIVVSDNGAKDHGTNSNAPFLGAKAEYFEGSFRTPLLMRWPGKIEAGKIYDAPVSLLDIFPTVARATGAALPANVEGRDLLATPVAPFKPLYWELFDTLSFSMLSADGRWRLSKSHYFPNLLLYDLEQEPAGVTDVAAQHPDIVQALWTDFHAWHDRTRRVVTTWEPLNDRGGAILRGDDLQRGPGRNDFTFAIGVSPQESTRAIQTIAHQARRWGLQLTERNRLHLTMLGEDIPGPKLATDTCSEVVVSARYFFTMLRPQNNKVTIDLFVNGARVAGSETLLPPLKLWGYANPTYVGIHSKGDRPFQGRLSRPLILNEKIVPDDPQAPLMLNGISGVPHTCAPSATPD